MAVLPVTRVSLGDSLRVSSPKIENTALQVNVVGIYTPISNMILVSEFKPGNGLIDLKLNADNENQHGTALRFLFSGAITQPRVTLGDQSKYGSHTIKTGAQAIRPSSFNSLSMGYAIISPQGVGNLQFDLNLPASIYQSKNIFFHFGPIVFAGVSAGNTSLFGNNKLINALNIKPTGIFLDTSNSYPFIYTRSKTYGVINFSLDNTSQSHDYRFNFGGASPLTKVGGINDSIVGQPSLTNTSDAIKVRGIYEGEYGKPLIYPVSNLDDYATYGVIDKNLQRQVQPQNALNIPFSFFIDIQFNVIGWQSSVIGSHKLINKKTIVRINGWQSSQLSELNNIKKNREVISSIGFASAQVGQPRLINSSRALSAIGITAIDVGIAKVYNLKQFVKLNSKDHSLFGVTFLKGGVKTITLSGIAPTAISAPKLTNTTANRSISINGIAPSSQPALPIITPYMLHLSGIAAGAIGVPKVALTPLIAPTGLIKTKYGGQTVWYHTRQLNALGFESYDTGYPLVFDPTQFVNTSQFNRTAVFGDTYIKNNRSYLKALSIDSEAVSEWAVLTNKNTALIARGFLALSIGNQEIKNKSPSIWFEGIKPLVIADHAIGARIRLVNTRGNDFHVLGRATITKTPELKPFGCSTSIVGTPDVSNYKRYINQVGFDSYEVSSPIVWFRYRYNKPDGWQSSKFSNITTLTHGVREIIGKGFIQQGYGLGWVSRGTRIVEMQSITTEQLSRHIVGGSRHIKPTGYIATLFGSRIIPINQHLLPLGFAGVLGKPFAYLKTQNIKGFGFLTVGIQPADRWGIANAYNKTQYVAMYYQGDSGLVPPPWSDWTLIANRNKSLKTVGLNSLRFGYSQIDNNATALAPLGIKPIVSDVGMIAHAKRYLELQGLGSMLVSTWIVVHNGARVIKPLGETHDTIGQHSTNNTRRYYKNVGRIDSLETGVPMIGYRIRTIDIEKRYSIAPPIIRLPTIDLLTKYVSFRGYETARYGLPSLVEKFNIINPRWSHREKLGNPALRNLTPELLTRGYDSSEFGVTAIRTEWRSVVAQGDTASLFGLTKISDTRQYLSVRGLLSSISSQRHTVTQLGTNDYVTQNIWLNDENKDNDGEGFGIYFNEQLLGTRVPEPYLNQNVIYTEGEEVLSFGSARIYSNNITVDGGIAIDNFSRNARIYNKTIYISIRSSDNSMIDSEIKCGEPRLSPWTIYAVVEAPYQAIKNHIPRTLHYIGQTDTEKAGEKFGSIKVESSIRSIKPKWVNFNTPSINNLGNPKADLSIRVLKPEPFRLTRYGIPIIPFTPSYMNKVGNFVTTLWGQPAVERAAYTGTQIINPKGLYVFSSGKQIAENFIRNIYARGDESLLMGNSVEDDTPFMWQGLRVGAHIPLVIGGLDALKFGDTVVGLRVRGVMAEGFDAFISNYNISSFEERMTVRNSYADAPEGRAISTLGIDSLVVNSSIIKLGQHYIRPDGNSDQFRKGGHYA